MEAEAKRKGCCLEVWPGERCCWAGRRGAVVARVLESGGGGDRLRFGLQERFYAGAAFNRRALHDLGRRAARMEKE